MTAFDYRVTTTNGPDVTTLKFYYFTVDPSYTEYIDIGYHTNVNIYYII
jgi:hypothetical protein